jgi:hypothetical protein
MVESVVTAQPQHRDVSMEDDLMSLQLRAIIPRRGFRMVGRQKTMMTTQVEDMGVVEICQSQKVVG